MDYKRIYEELIEHRKMLPRLKGVYYERHHIVPRCMGGGDEEENLVYLTAEDHFMAHLLLAKAYDVDGLWFAAKAMTMPTKNGRFVTNRRTFGIIRRMAHSAMKGRKEEDNTIYTIKDNRNGALYRGTKEDIKNMYEIPFRQISELSLGVKEAFNGFSIAKDDDVDVGLEDHLEYVFYNPKRDLEIVGTRSELVRWYCVPDDEVNELVTGKQREQRGWRVKAAHREFYSCQKIKNFRFLETGKIYNMTPYHLALKFKLDHSKVKKLVDGSLIFHEGFCMETVPLHDDRLQLLYSRYLFSRGADKSPPLSLKTITERRCYPTVVLPT